MSAQLQWLKDDLGAHPAACTLSYWHRPVFSSVEHGNNPNMQEAWKVLHERGVDVVVNGHDHDYERFANDATIACSTLPSWMFVRLPIAITPLSPRITTIGQTLESAAMLTVPWT